MTNLWQSLTEILFLKEKKHQKTINERETVVGLKKIFARNRSIENLGPHVYFVAGLHFDNTYHVVWKSP